MTRSHEFTGQSDPKQHLVDLGVPSDFVDMLRTILSESQTLRDTSKIIRSGKVNTALGGTQLTSPLIRVLYDDDPEVRTVFKDRLAKYNLSDDVLDTYFRTRQQGFVDVMAHHREIVDRMGKEKMGEFISDADNMAYGFLREYFGFT